MRWLTKRYTLLDALLLSKNELFLLTRDFALIFGFAILTGISAKLKIEIGPVPVTMQTLAVLLSGAVLGAKRGVSSQLVYLGMGLAGLPWFAKGGGLGYILSPTFGYLLGFILCAWVVGFLAERGFDRNLKTAILAMALGNGILYIPGLLWLGKFVGYKKVLAVGFFPFIFGDILKVFLAASLLPLLWKIIKK